MSSIGANSGSVAVTTQGKYNVVPPTYTDGAATELQTDVNGVLLTKDSAVTALAKGAGATSAATLRAVLATDQSSIPVTQSGTWSQRLQDGAGSAVNKGQAAMAASLPVAIASDQSAVPASQSGTWSQRLQDGAGSAVNKGQAAMAGSLPVALASDQSAIPATQSGTWSQRLQDGSGSAVNKGQTTMAGSLPVTIASDQGALSVTPGRLSVIDQIDTSPGPVLDASVTTINSNVGAFVTVVATLAAAAKAIRVCDTTGNFIGVYTGAGGSEALAFIIEPGMADVIEHAIPINTRLSVRAMGSSSITSGNLTLQALG